jgi:lipoprotein-anchoring transpeptidase ErfK/SrfK
MKTTKGETRSAALAAMVIMTAISALAEEKARRIVVSIQDRKLALLEGDTVIKIWDTAVGAESTPSPCGNYTIVNRLSKPTWYQPGKAVPPGPSNPLGTRWLGLSIRGYGIHGTNVPGSIGKKASHGCIRMRNRDVEELFELVKAGDVVEIYGERNLSLAEIFKTEPLSAALPILSASSAASFSVN